MAFEFVELLLQSRDLRLELEGMAFEFEDELAGRDGVGVLDRCQDFLAGVGDVHGGILSPDKKRGRKGPVLYHSAAIAAPRFDLMRSSISSRKLRIKPWIGHAAASPSAQIV